MPKLNDRIIDNIKGYFKENGMSNYELKDIRQPHENSPIFVIADLKHPSPAAPGNTTVWRWNEDKQALTNGRYSLPEDRVDEYIKMIDDNTNKPIPEDEMELDMEFSENGPAL